MSPVRAEQIGTLQTGQSLMRFAVEVEACAEDQPQWIHVLPLGPHFDARDGRKFTVRDAATVMQATELPMLVDWEHNSESGDTRAAGWINELKLETDGDKAGLWGRVKWTPQGREHVSTQHYRFLSPVVLGKRELSEATSEVRFSVERMTSVALTNRPALRMHGIEQLREQMSHRLGPIADHQESPMNDQTRRALCQAFGLSVEATDEQLVQAAKPADKTNVEALRSACETLTEELNAQRTETKELREMLSAQRAATFKNEVTSFLDEGARVGKIPPAARKRWAEFCSRSPENFTTFKDTIYPGLAVIAPATGSTKNTTKQSLKSGSSAHGVDREALKKLGLTDEQIALSEAEVFEGGNKPKARADEPDEDEDDEDDDADQGGDEDDDKQPAAGKTPEQPQTGG